MESNVSVLNYSSNLSRVVMRKWGKNIDHTNMIRKWGILLDSATRTDKRTTLLDILISILFSSTQDSIEKI